MSTGDIMIARKKVRHDEVGTPVYLRLQSDTLQLLEQYRRSQPDLPSRQEAIKRLIEATAED
jgi:hypothetical protein